MAHPLLFLAAVGATGFGLLTATQHRLPEDQRPLSKVPDGVDAAKPLAVQTVSVSSGRRYKLSSFAVPNGSVYYVAERKGAVDWLGYLQQPGTSARLLWGASAEAESLEAMVRDFEVTAAPPQLGAA